MSVSDVQFIKDNSEKTGHIINIDSSERDKVAYPSASHFSVTFDQNFQYVYGLNVIDANMPSSMYNIENYNNTLKYHLAWFTDPVNDRDSFTNDVFIHLHAFSIFAPFFKEVYSKSNGGSPEFTSQRIVIGKEGKTSPLASDNGPNLFTQPQLYPKMNVRQVDSLFSGSEYYYIGGNGQVSNSDESFGKLYRATNISAIEALAPFVKRVDVISKFQKEYRGYPIYNRSESPINVIPEALILGDGRLLTYNGYSFSDNEYARVFGGMNQTNSLDSLDWCRMIIQSSSVSLDPGNYTLFSFRDQINSLIDQSFIVNSTSGGTVGFPFTGSQKISFKKTNLQGEVTKTSKLKLTMTSASSLFFLDYEMSNLSKVIGFSTVSKKVEIDASYKLMRMSDNMSYIFSLKQGIDEEQAIIPHGVIYLLGPRYVTLRCPEIESYNSYMNNVSKGIGVFKLAMNQEMMQQRLDFIQYIKKPFNPIEKLNKLTFRFELPDGSPYDFKGIDMFMILQVNCYVLVLPKLDDSITNPEYNSNLIELQRRDFERNNIVESFGSNTSEEDSDDDNIVKELNSYMQEPSSKVSKS
jgi:hypothetical protein